MINLNPYSILFTGSKKKLLQDNYSTIYKHTYEPILKDDSTQDDTCQCGQQSNQLIDQVNPPVFLKRNLKRMKKVRSKEAVSKLLTDPSKVSFNLTYSILPQTKMVLFDTKGEDVLDGGSLLRKRRLSERQMA